MLGPFSVTPFLEVTFVTFLRCFNLVGFAKKTKKIHTVWQKPRNITKFKSVTLWHLEMSQNVTKCHSFSNLRYKATCTFYVWIGLGTALNVNFVHQFNQKKPPPQAEGGVMEENKNDQQKRVLKRKKAFARLPIRLAMVWVTWRAEFVAVTFALSLSNSGTVQWFPNIGLIKQSNTVISVQLCSTLTAIFPCVALSSEDFSLFLICMLGWLPNPKKSYDSNLSANSLSSRSIFLKHLVNNDSFLSLFVRDQNSKVSSLPSPRGRRGVFLIRSWPVPRICFPWHGSCALKGKAHYWKGILFTILTALLWTYSALPGRRHSDGRYVPSKWLGLVCWSWLARGCREDAAHKHPHRFVPTAGPPL